MHWGEFVRPGLLAAIAAAAAPGCDGRSAAAPRASAGAAVGPTYARDVGPIVAARCAGCHAPGAFAPFSLQTYADVVAHLQDCVGAVSSGYMPPWVPDDGCNSYVGDRSLSASERATLLAWAAAGAPEGDPDAAAPAVAVTPPGSLPRVDYTLQMPQPYTPQLTPDEYRCFLVDWPATSDTFVTGYSVHPGNAAIVHHVVAFVAQPGDVTGLQAMSGRDGHPGYPCFGGSGSASSLSTAGNWLGIWAPGSVGTTYGNGSDTGLRVRPGSKIVLQMHYHLYGSTAGVTPDQSSIELMVAPSVTTEGYMLPFLNPLWDLNPQGFTLPAGDANVQQGFSLSPFPLVAALDGVLPQKLVVHNVGVHMHQLGSSGSLRVLPAGGGASTCLINIPKWDFHWQDLYKLESTFTLQRGDRLQLQCVYDNSAAGQPTVNGAKQAPTTVHWGEKSSDEMCLGLLYVAPG